jgi:hypothetical protein
MLANALRYKSLFTSTVLGAGEVKTTALDLTSKTKLVIFMRGLQEWFGRPV